MTIRKFRISVDYFASQFIHPHGRTSWRLKGWKCFAYGVKLLMADFISWRDTSITKAQVTNETASLEWYLNHLFDPTDKRIYIETNDGSGLPLGIRDVEPDKVQLGIRGVEPNKVQMSLRGEHPELGFSAFGVFLPAALNGYQSSIKAVLNRYRFAGKTFTFINY